MEGRAPARKVRMTSTNQALRRLEGLFPSFLEILSPECCAVCGRRRGRLPWATGGEGPAPGLRFWHATHCCAACLDRWKGAPQVGRCGDLPVWSAQIESADLVGIIGSWKYGRMCGLARPLAALLTPVLQAASLDSGPVMLVTLPLHVRRRRTRGFDQTRQLAVLCSRATAIPVAHDVLVRRRSTGQQASRPTDDASRIANVTGAFRARPPRADDHPRVALLDDLVTTGATMCAAADALLDAGWDVAWCAALGMAKRLLVDTVEHSSLASSPCLGDDGSAARDDIRQEQA
jgi:ComF family protein